MYSHWQPSTQFCFYTYKITLCCSHVMLKWLKCRQFIYYDFNTLKGFIKDFRSSRKLTLKNHSASNYANMCTHFCKVNYGRVYLFTEKGIACYLRDSKNHSNNTQRLLLQTETVINDFQWINSSFLSLKRAGAVSYISLCSQSLGKFYFQKRN